MREKDELAKTLETIEKKAKLAVMKDNIGIDELTKSSDGQNERFTMCIVNYSVSSDIMTA